MSNERFTQGEWRANQRPHGKVSIVGDNGKQVCLMWNSKERDANCYLISAAPDVYRALREAVEKLSEMSYRTEDALDIARWKAALAKADGVE